MKNLLHRLITVVAVMATTVSAQILNDQNQYTVQCWVDADGTTIDRWLQWDPLAKCFATNDFVHGTLSLATPVAPLTPCATEFDDWEQACSTTLGPIWVSPSGPIFLSLDGTPIAASAVGAVVDCELYFERRCVVDPTTGEQVATVFQPPGAVSAGSGGSLPPGQVACPQQITLQHPASLSFGATNLTVLSAGGSPGEYSGGDITYSITISWNGDGNAFGDYDPCCPTVGTVVEYNAGQATVVEASGTVIWDCPDAPPPVPVQYFEYLNGAWTNASPSGIVVACERIVHEYAVCYAGADGAPTPGSVRVVSFADAEIIRTVLDVEGREITNRIVVCGSDTHTTLYCGTIITNWVDNGEAGERPTYELDYRRDYTFTITLSDGRVVSTSLPSAASNPDWFTNWAAAMSLATGHQWVPDLLAGDGDTTTPVGFHLVASLCPGDVQVVGLSSLSDTGIAADHLVGSDTGPKKKYYECFTKGGGSTWYDDTGTIYTGDLPPCLYADCALPENPTLLAQQCTSTILGPACDWDIAAGSSITSDVYLARDCNGTISFFTINEDESDPYTMLGEYRQCDGTLVPLESPKSKQSWGAVVEAGRSSIAVPGPSAGCRCIAVENASCCDWIRLTLSAADGSTHTIPVRPRTSMAAPCCIAADITGVGIDVVVPPATGAYDFAALVGSPAQKPVHVVVRYE